MPGKHNSIIHSYVNRSIQLSRRTLLQRYTHTLLFIKNKKNCPVFMRSFAGRSHAKKTKCHLSNSTSFDFYYGNFSHPTLRFLLYFQLSELEQRVVEAEERAEEAEDKVSGNGKQRIFKKPSK